MLQNPIILCSTINRPSSPVIPPGMTQTQIVDITPTTNAVRGSIKISQPTKDGNMAGEEKKKEVAAAEVEAAVEVEEAKERVVEEELKHELEWKEEEALVVGEEAAVAELHPLSPAIMDNQATINLITMGHVAHGKSSLMKALSGISTGRHLDEKRLNMTIRLGYANVKIFKCTNPDCYPPKCYAPFPSTEMAPSCEVCKQSSRGEHEMTLMRHISFVDSPGHQKLMTTMISGTSAVDGGLLIIAGDQECPQPQTTEHIAAAHMMGLIQKDHIIVLQNKLDLCPPQRAEQSKREIDRFVYHAELPEDAPVIPICAQQGYNIDVLCEYLVNKLPIPRREIVNSQPRMTLIRSFDVNKPGFSWRQLKGGVVGGTLTQGVLRVGQTVEIRPGVQTRDGSVRPIRTTILSLQSEQTALEYAIPGGLIAVGLTIDPTLTKADRMVGHVLGDVGTLPPVFKQVRLQYRLMKDLIENKNGKKKKKPKHPKKGARLLLNIGSMKIEGVVNKVVEKGVMELKLVSSVCADIGTRVAICGRDSESENRWRLIGAGFISGLVRMRLAD